MILLTSEDSLQVALAGAVTTAQPVLYAAYADHSSTAFSPGGSSGATNNAIAVEWVAAPSSGYVRQVKYLSLYNTDSATVTASVRVNDNGTARNLLEIELEAGERLEYTDGRGFRVLMATGAEKGPTIGDVVGPASSTDNRIAVFDGITGKLLKDGGKTINEVRTIPIGVACSDETTALTAGAAKATFRMPFAFTLTGVRATLTTAPTGSALTVDINEAGVSILSTKLTIDAGEKTSTTAAAPAVISDSALADDAEITVDIDAVGSTVAGAGLKVWLIGYPA